MPADRPAFVEHVEMTGHIIDSLLLAQGARRDPDARRALRHQGHSDSASGRTTPASPASKSGPTVAEQLERILAEIHPHGAVTAARRATAAPCRPTWTARSPKASTAPPTSAPRSGSSGEWIDVEDQEMDCGILVDPEGGGGPLRADDRREEGRPHRRRPAGHARVPARGRDAQHEPVRVHGQPGFQREAQGRDACARSPPPCAQTRAAGEKILAVLGPGGRPHRQRRAHLRS